MINIFQLADNDQAVIYLGQIFGNVGIALSGSGSAILGNMFKTFNTVLLVIGSFFVVYITVVGVMTSAQEGEFMKKWNSLWTPLRMLIGIVALFPTGSGYCAIQVVVMWLIIQGVGAADMVWKTSVDFIGYGGSLNPQQVNPDTQTGSQPAGGSPAGLTVPGAMTKLFGSLVCQSAVAKFTAKKPGQTGDEKAYGRSTLSGDSYLFGPNGECGTLSWSNSDKALQTGLGTAYMTLVPALEQIADKYVNMVIADGGCWQTCNAAGDPACYFGKYQYMNFSANNKSNCTLSNSNSWSEILTYTGSNFIADSLQLFQGYANNYVVNQQVENQRNQAGSQTSADLQNDAYKKAEANGWIFAGSYYYYIARRMNESSDGLAQFYQAIKVPDIIGNFTSGTYPDLQAPYPIVNFYCGYLDDKGACQSDYGALGIGKLANQAMLDAADQGGGIVIQSNAGSDLDAVSNNTLSTWMSNLNGSAKQSNPIVEVQYFGKTCLITAEVLFWIGLGGTIGLGVLATHIVVFGNTATPWYGAAQAALSYLMPVYFFFIGYLITIGAMLGVYVPLIPYTLFLFGVIAWFTAVLEAMVSAPLIALGILSPGGQHEIMGKAEPAIMILMNVIFRPVLMVFGMFAAMLLSYVVMRLINGSFLSVVGSISGTGAGQSNRGMGLIEACVFILAYAGLVVTALNKCFMLIVVFPSQAFRVIGGQAEAGGEAESSEQVKGKVSAAGEAAGRASSGVGSKASSDEGAIKTQFGREKRQEKRTPSKSKGAGISGKRE